MFAYVVIILCTLGFAAMGTLIWHVALSPQARVANAQYAYADVRTPKAVKGWSDAAQARGAERLAEHAQGQHDFRPLLGCPRCG